MSDILGLRRLWENIKIQWFSLIMSIRLLMAVRKMQKDNENLREILLKNINVEVDEFEEIKDKIGRAY